MSALADVDTSTTSLRPIERYGQSVYEPPHWSQRPKIWERAFAVCLGEPLDHRLPSKMRLRKPWPASVRESALARRSARVTDHRLLAFHRGPLGGSEREERLHVMVRFPRETRRADPTDERRIGVDDERVLIRAGHTGPTEESASMIQPAYLTAATTTDRRRDAAIASIVVNVLSAPLFFLLPGADEAPLGAVIFGLVLGAVAAVGAWGLLHGRRWGWRTTVIATVLNVLSSAPAIAAWPSAWVGVSVIMLTVVGIALLFVLRRPDVRILR